MLAVTTTPKSWRETNLLTKHSPKIHPALGLHPQLIPSRNHDFALFEALIGEAKFIGEVGLDGSNEFKQHLPQQKKILNEILYLCEKDNGKIISVHSRGAVADILRIFEQYPYCGNIILHWFTGSIEEAKQAVGLGCYFSINYSMLRSKKGVELINSLPKNRILTESDGPFVAYNKQPFSPIKMPVVIDFLSKMWSVSKEETDAIIHNNYTSLLDV